MHLFRYSIFVFGLLASGSATASLREKLEPFFDQHCYACHDDFDMEADLNLLDLEFKPKDRKNRQLWEKIFHRVETGEMPPKKEKRPAKEEKAGFLEVFEKSLIEAGRQEIQKSGRVHSRRLTVTEYENSVHDLLGVDLPLADELTDDVEEGFTTSSATQQLSHFHLDNYLRVSDLALEEAFTRALDGEENFHKEIPAKLATKSGRGNNRGPQLVQGKAISWASRLQFAGRVTQTKVPATGWYRVTVHDFDAVNPGPDGVLWSSLQTGSGYSNEPLLSPVGLLEATGEPATKSFLCWMKKDHLLVLKPDEAALKGIPGKGGNFRFAKAGYERQGISGLRYEGLTLERVYPNANRMQVRRSLFANLPPEDYNTGGSEPSSQLERLIKRFAKRAFRRPPTAGQVSRYQILAEAEMEAGAPFPLALRRAYHAVLCSPHFLTFVENAGALDDYAIASRLSFLLWKTIPDSHLRKLADAGKLRDEKVLVGEIDRLLRDPKASRFFEDFADQWLDLRSIDATQPDPKRYRDFDLPLRLSIVEETRAFLTELIREDYPVTQLLQSDFSFLNTRLQDHYRLPNLEIKPGAELQKVKVGPNRRSGLLTQGSILKVTADGSVSSPIIRGVWVNERILGRHILPPPPGTPAVEPDIRGAVSIRDQLAKHRDSTSCASCHDKIDPSGFALESYDPIGRFRKAYGTKKNSAKVDPSGVVKDGQKFANFGEWRAIYLKQPDLIARNFVVQLLKYGTGGTVGFSDRPVIDQIITENRGNNYGLRSLLISSLKSEIFLNK